VRVGGGRWGCRVGEGRGRVCGGFFFSSRRRHTSSDRDWSSDVCSSDLKGSCAPGPSLSPPPPPAPPFPGTPSPDSPEPSHCSGKIGRASCRERVQITVRDVAGKKKRYRRPDNGATYELSCLPDTTGRRP